MKELFEANQILDAVFEFNENTKCGYCDVTAKDLGCKTEYIMFHHVHACKHYGVGSE